MMLMALMQDELETTEPEPVPAAIAMVMSALEAGDHPREMENRTVPRISYRTTTQLRLFRDQPSTPAWKVYTRDINRRGMGFVTAHRLPLGYGGIVMLPDAHGELKGVHCTLSRCREASPGLFEGCLHFNREQPHFDGGLVQQTDDGE